MPKKNKHRRSAKGVRKEVTYDCTHEGRDWKKGVKEGEGESTEFQLTVQRNVKGNTMAPTPGSLSTKLDPPSIFVVELPNEQPVDMLAPCSVVWYSLRHNRNAVVHGEQPEKGK